MKKIISPIIIICGLGAVAVIIAYFAANGKQMNEFVKQDQERPAQTQKVVEQTNKLKAQNDCMMQVLRDTNTYKNAHPNLTAKEAEDLKNSITTKQEDCQKQFPL